jgi:hypothetical protein
VSVVENRHVPRPFPSRMREASKGRKKKREEKKLECERKFGDLRCRRTATYTT